ncbi:NEDD4-binding protein 1-like [Hetaerina americana]|uniref:NEDD4-binding protein 1-like n=1 Tax=Hetaerina americana TaxID=62018 RepID=UPI003A7F299B
MRGSRTPRKVIASNLRNRRVAFRRKYHSPRSVWIVNDDGHPKSPLSIERLPGSTKRSISRVARVKPTCREMVRKRGITPEDPFLFFIDKNRSEELADVGPNHMNESVILVESPTVSTAITEVPSGRRRQESVDTVDLCSDGEEQNTATNNRTKRKRQEGVSGEKRRKLCTKAQADQQPDVIVLDDEDEDADQSCKNNTSVIVDSVQIKTSNNARCSDNPPSTSSASGSRKTRSVAPYSGRDSKFRSKYLDKSQTVSHEKGVELSRNTNPAPSEKVAESSSTMPDLLDSVGSNVFNPCGNVQQTGLRPIIIDGCNVAIAHGGNRMFSVRGLCICVEYFLRRGHDKVVAVVPLHQRSKVSPHDRDVLEALKDDGHLVFTPSRYIDNRLISSYDDRYIVQYAVAVGGVIVSRDNYRDLLTENPAWRDTITNRLLMPTWVGDILMFPVDPLGKSGPSLDDFLQFPRK